MKFEMNKKESEAANEWIKQHLYKHHNGKWPYAGAAGGSLSYQFTPTGLGTCVQVQCNHCRDKGPEGFKDVTDMDLW